MPSVNKNESVGPGATLDVMADSQYTYLNFPARVDFVALGDAAATFTAQIITGSDVLFETGPIDVKPVAEPIQIPDDVLVSDVVAAAERIGFKVTNTGGAAAVVRARVIISPI